MEKVIIVLNLISLIVPVYSKIPSYIKLCGRRNPRLNDCIKDSVEQLREKFAEGMPEFDVLSIEPFELPGSLTIANTSSFRASADHVQIHGTTKYEIHRINWDPVTGNNDFEISFKKLKITGTYHIETRILVPIVTNGPIKIETASYMHVCGRRNPNLNQCVRDSVEALRDKIAEGIPELDVPPSEPFHLDDEIPLVDSPGIRAIAQNLDVSGFKSFKPTTINVDLDKQQLDIEVHFDKLNLKGDYDVAAKIVVPVKAKGPVEIDAMDITGKVVLKYRLVPTKRGERLFFYEMTLKLTIKDYTSKFKPTVGPDVTFADAINAVLNQNRQEIIDGIRPSLEKSISAHILQIANRICKNFTFDELYPDRE